MKYIWDFMLFSENIVCVDLKTVFCQPDIVGEIFFLDAGLCYPKFTLKNPINILIPSNMFMLYIIGSGFMLKLKKSIKIYKIDEAIDTYFYIET